MKRLIIYRLFDSTYGPQGNPRTLSVFLHEDNTIGYSQFNGWQDSGMGYAISNLQLKESLPIGVRKFKKVEELHDVISRILKTGVGSNEIKTFEILNDL